MGSQRVRHDWVTFTFSSLSRSGRTWSLYKTRQVGYQVWPTRRVHVALRYHVWPRRATWSGDPPHSPSPINSQWGGGAGDGDSKRRLWRKWGAWLFQVQGSTGEKGKEMMGAELWDSKRCPPVGVTWGIPVVDKKYLDKMRDTLIANGFCPAMPVTER